MQTPERETTSDGRAPFGSNHLGHFALTARAAAAASRGFGAAVSLSSVAARFGKNPFRRPELWSGTYSRDHLLLPVQIGRLMFALELDQLSRDLAGESSPTPPTLTDQDQPAHRGAVARQNKPTALAQIYQFSWRFMPLWQDVEGGSTPITCRSRPVGQQRRLLRTARFQELMGGGVTEAALPEQPKVS